MQPNTFFFSNTPSVSLVHQCKCGEMHTLSDIYSSERVLIYWEYEEKLPANHFDTLHQ